MCSATNERQRTWYERGRIEFYVISSAQWNNLDENLMLFCLSVGVMLFTWKHFSLFVIFIRFLNTFN